MCAAAHRRHPTKLLIKILYSGNLSLVLKPSGVFLVSPSSPSSFLLCNTGNDEALFSLFLHTSTIWFKPSFTSCSGHPLSPKTCKWTYLTWAGQKTIFQGMWWSHRAPAPISQHTAPVHPQCPPNWILKRLRMEEQPRKILDGVWQLELSDSRSLPQASLKLPQRKDNVILWIYYLFAKIKAGVMLWSS